MQNKGDKNTSKSPKPSGLAAFNKAVEDLPYPRLIEGCSAQKWQLLWLARKQAEQQAVEAHWRALNRASDKLEDPLIMAMIRLDLEICNEIINLVQTIVVNGDLLFAFPETSVFEMGAV